MHEIPMFSDDAPVTEENVERAKLPPAAQLIYDLYMLEANSGIQTDPPAAKED